MITRIHKPRDYWTESLVLGSTPIHVQMTRFGLLWHAEANRIVDGSRIDRIALATAWGADQEQVYHQVIERSQELL